MVTVGTGASMHLCATYLAEFGADVVRLEPPGGDAMRVVRPDGGPAGLAWACVARAGRSVVCDTAADHGRELLRRIVRDADIVCNGHPADVLSDLVEPLPDHAIVLQHSMSGPGSEPFVGVAEGLLAAAGGGLLWLTGYPDQPPMRLGSDYVEHLTAAFAAQAACAALVRRRTSGRGSRIQADSVGAVLRILEWTIPAFQFNGTVRKREGNHPSQVAPLGLFDTVDGLHVALIGGSDANYSRLVAAMDAPELLDDPRFLTSAARSAHHVEINRIVGRWAAELPADEILDRIRRSGALGALVPQIEDVLADEQVAARGDVVYVDDPELGPHRQPAPQPLAPSLRPVTTWGSSPVGAAESDRA